MVILVTFGGGGCLGGHPLRPVGAHVGSETICGRFLTDFGLLLGRPGEHFGGHLGARVSNLEGLCRFFGVFFGASQKGQKKLPKVVQKGSGRSEVLRRPDGYEVGP